LHGVVTSIETTAHRRAGVDQALISCCRAADVKTIWAGTDVENTAAPRAFERTGAVEVGDFYVEYEWKLD
jgi:hypothetical protein